MARSTCWDFKHAEIRLLQKSQRFSSAFGHEQNGLYLKKQTFLLKPESVLDPRLAKIQKHYQCCTETYIPVYYAKWQMMHDLGVMKLKRLKHDGILRILTIHPLTCKWYYLDGSLLILKLLEVVTGTPSLLLASCEPVHKHWSMHCTITDPTQWIHLCCYRLTIHKEHSFQQDWQQCSFASRLIIWKLLQ